VKEVPIVDWARRLLNDQLERIGELRNANPRDSGFKQWRQTTLTVIQRIWPGDLARSECFRRITFSPPNPKATKTQAKEHFERGCAEAVGYLKALSLELDTRGLRAPEVADAPGGPAPLPAELAGTLEGMDPGQGDSFGALDMYEPSPFDKIKPATGGSFPGPLPEEEPPAPTQRSARRSAKGKQPPLPPPPEPMAEEEPPARGYRRTDRRALKEMLGFADDSSGGGSPAARSSGIEPSEPPDELEEDSLEPSPPPPAFAAHEEPQRPAPASGVPGLSRRPPPPPPQSASDLEIDFLSRFGGKTKTAGSQPSAPSAPTSRAPAPPPAPPVAPTPRPPATPVARPPAAPAAVRPPAPAPARPPAPPPAPAPRPPAVAPVPPPPTTGRTPAASPVRPPAVAAPSPYADVPRRPEPISHAEAPAARTPAAAAFVALAGEVGRLGVPEGQRAAARAALLDFARQLDDDEATWDSIREFLWLVADYPALGRQAIPLLIPFLDLE
jgi:hypothetical protein